MSRLGRRSPVLMAAFLAALAGGVAASPPDDAAVKNLRAAFADGTAEELRIEALEESAAIEDPAIVDEIAKALRDRNVEVRRAAIDALGKNKHPDALRELHALYRRDEKLRKDEETFVRLLQAIGRKGAPASVEVLSSDVFDHITLRTARARVMGLGRIRTKDSVETLVKLSRLSGGDTRRRVQSQTDARAIIDRDFRLSLAVLTGQDLGNDRGEWSRWWNDNKSKLQVAPERPALEAPFVKQWEEYWGEPYGSAPKSAANVAAPMVVTKNPLKEDVEIAVAALKEAFSSKGDADARTLAIDQYGGLADPDVVAAVGKGLDDPDDGVRLEAIDTLGWVPLPEALKALHRLYKRDKALRENEVLFARLLQAIGRHSDRSSIEVLKDNPFDHLTVASGRARILGLGRIRDVRSVESLIAGMQLAGSDARGRRTGQPRHGDDFRLALASLTGEDLGPTKDAWITWWRGAKSGFKVAPERPPLSSDLETAWVSYWNEAY
jgi:HEAT repeat protein